MQDGGLLSYRSDLAGLLGELSHIIYVKQLIQCWLLRGWSADGSYDGVGGAATKFEKKT